MKQGNDESFRHSNKPKSIYDDVTQELTEYEYNMELYKYNELRWRRGLLHNVVPATIYGTIGGFLWGISESRRGLVRHVNRARIIAGNTFSGAGISLCIAATHHGLLMAADYKAAVWQPVAAGGIGGATFSVLSEGMSASKGATGGFIVGVIYTVITLGAQKYQERSLTNFFIAQQQQEIPVHKVAPELQRLYRAWLYDHRPIEDLDKMKREALILDREATDTRLDAATFMRAMTIDQLDWMEFPEWWPLKFAPKAEKAQMVEKRLRDDAYERRKSALLENQVMFSHPMRTQSGRSTSDGQLEMPSDRD
jgi:hypothetical protein